MIAGIFVAGPAAKACLAQAQGVAAAWTSLAILAVSLIAVVLQILGVF